MVSFEQLNLDYPVVWTANIATDTLLGNGRRKRLHYEAVWNSPPAALSCLGFFCLFFFFCAEVEDCVMEKTRWQWEEVPGSVLNGRQVLIAHIDAGCWWWLVECEEERWLSKTGVVFRRHEIHHLVDGTWKESWKQTALQKHQPIMCKSNLQKDIWKNLSDFCFGLHISHRPVHQSVGTVV